MEGYKMRVEPVDFDKHLDEAKLRAYVEERVKPGSTILVPEDSYNTEKKSKAVERTVAQFCDHYILVVDEYGRRECFTYYDAYLCLSGKYWEG